MTAYVPIADSAGAASAIIVIAVIALALIGIFVLAARGSKRRRAEEPEATQSAVEEPTAEVEPNIGGMGLAVAAAILATVSVFLPALESSAFATIAKNTLIQSGGGWLILGCAIGILGAVYRVHSRRMPTWAVFLLGLVILGTAIYEGTGDRTKLESLGSPFLHESVVVSGSPAVGLYAAGAAGLMAMFAGLVLAGHVFESYQGADRHTKVCPDCAESVLDAARICKHCGHQFDPTLHQA